MRKLRKKTEKEEEEDNLFFKPMGHLITKLSAVYMFMAKNMTTYLPCQAFENMRLSFNLLAWAVQEGTYKALNIQECILTLHPSNLPFYLHCIPLMCLDYNSKVI